MDPLQGFPVDDEDRFDKSATYVVMSTGRAADAPGIAGNLASTDVPSSSRAGTPRDVARLRILFTIPNDAESLSLDYKFATEERPSTGYPDQF